MAALNQRQKQIKQYQFIKLGAFFALMSLGILIILKVESLLVTTVFGFVLSYLLSPIVDAFERKGLSRLQSIILGFTAFTLALAIGISSITPFLVEQVQSLREDMPKYIEGTIRIITSLESYIKAFSGDIVEVNLGETVKSFLVIKSGALFQNLPGLVSKSLSTLLLSPFFAFFILKDGQVLSRKLLSLVPNNVFELTLNLYHQIDDQMAQFVRARLIEAGIVGAVVLLGLLIIGFPYAFLLAFFAAVLNLIPYIGPIIGAVPAITIALINGGTGFTLVFVVSTYALAQLIDILFIIPLLVAKIVDLHPVTVVIALVLGFQLMGILGMVIAIPLGSALKLTTITIYKHLTELRV